MQSSGEPAADEGIKRINLERMSPIDRGTTRSSSGAEEPGKLVLTNRWPTEDAYDLARRSSVVGDR